MKAKKVLSKKHSAFDLYLESKLFSQFTREGTRRRFTVLYSAAREITEVVALRTAYEKGILMANRGYTVVETVRANRN